MDERAKINARLTKQLKEKSFKILHRLDQESEDAVNVNRSLLMRIVKDNKDTEFGKKHSFDKITDPDSYRKKIPLSTYEDYEDIFRSVKEWLEEDGSY